MPDRYREIVRKLGHRRWVAAFARRFGAPLERTLYRLSGGRLCPTGSVVPVLLLTTVGRRSGRERTTPMMYIRDGHRFAAARTSGRGDPPPGR